MVAISLALHLNELYPALHLPIMSGHMGDIAWLQLRDPLA